MPYLDMNELINRCHPQPTPCELAAENDKLKQKVAALCKERDELRSALNRTVKRLDDETIELEKAKKMLEETNAKQNF